MPPWRSNPMLQGIRPLWFFGALAIGLRRRN
jgi:hypothetical protein